MVALVEIDQRLRDTEGYTVESPEGDVGRVEEVRFGDGGETYALDVELLDGSHTLLRADDVLAVDRDYRWVVVPSPPGGREDAPSEPVPSTAQPKPARPLWQVVALLYGTVALVVALVMLCAFLIAYAIAGAPY